ncbi:MAG: hypothetical protein ABSE82_03710 [Nitrososphaerales archaeon]|jgi:hypothetical protein
MWLQFVRGDIDVNVKFAFGYSLYGIHVRYTELFSLSTKPDEEKKVERRKILSGGIGFVLNAYLQSSSLLNSAGLAASALEQYEKQLSKQEAEMRAMVSQIENLRATFEDGRLVVHMDKTTILGLVERMLKKSFAVKEAGMTATFTIDSDTDGDNDHEGELTLPNRSIYLKFLPVGKPAMEFVDSHLERARNMNPSEYWLLTPIDENIDIQFEPIFTANKITRGRLRTYPLTSLLTEMIGKDYDLEAIHDVDGGFRFIISKNKEVISDNEKS